MQLDSGSLQAFKDRIARPTHDPPYQLLAAAARVATGEPELVLGEARKEGDSTIWRLVWLSGAHLGIATGTADMPGWSMRIADDPTNVAVGAELRLLADCQRVSYAQKRASLNQWGGQSYDSVGALALHFDNGTVEFDVDEWRMTGDPGSQDQFQVAVLERWAKLRSEA